MFDWLIKIWMAPKTINFKAQRKKGANFYQSKNSIYNNSKMKHIVHGAHFSALEKND